MHNTLSPALKWLGSKGSRKRDVCLGSTLLLWTFILLGLFLIASLSVHGFRTMHKYGHNGFGQNYIYYTTIKEKVFYAGQALFILPATIILSLAFLKFFPNPYSGLKRLLGDDNFRKRLILAFVLLAFLSTLLVSLTVYRGRLLFDDEQVYLMQARIFKSLHLTLPSPAHQRFYDAVFMVNNGKWFGQYPFGYPFFLLLGLLLGIPYLTNAFAAGIVVYLIYKLALLLDGDAFTALLASFLLVISPFFILTSATLLAHTTTILFITASIYAGFKGLKTNSVIWGILFGIFWGIAFHIRGIVSFLIILPVFVYIVYEALKARNWRLIAGIILSTTVSIGSYFLLNYIVNGNPLITNYHAAWLGKTEAISPFGFGKKAWKMEHTFTLGFTSMIKNAIRLHFWLWGSALGFLLPLLSLPVRKKWEYSLWLGPVAFFITMVFYFWPGTSNTGPVLYSKCIIPICLLAALGIKRIWYKLDEKVGGAAWHNFLISFVPSLLLISLLSFWLVHLRKIDYTLTRADEPLRMINKAGLKDDVVFWMYYTKPLEQRSWLAGRPLSHPYFKEDIIYLRNLGKDKDIDLMKEVYPGKRAYVFFYRDDDAFLIPLEEYEDMMLVPERSIPYFLQESNNGFLKLFED